MPTILVLHGPNMALRGVSGIDEALETRASELGVEISIIHSNSEGGLLDALHERRYEIDGIIVNPGALAPSAWALAEAIDLLKTPAIEVLLQPPARGPSALAPVVSRQIHDQGANAYVLALEDLARIVPAETLDDEVLADRPEVGEERGEEKEDGEDGVTERDEAPSGAANGRRGPRLPEKSIGRKKPPESVASPSRPEKTIGRKPSPPPPSPSHSTEKSLGRRATTPAAVPSGLTRAQLRERVSARLSGKTSTEELASWARGEWSSLQKGGPCEEGQRDLLDSVLLALMGGARTSEHILLAQLAKLD
jgi:3-dehydroquinate dehydratase II